jgi:hypothetical protein
MSVISGIDPHESTHTAVAIDTDEQPRARLQMRADRCQTARLLAWAINAGALTADANPSERDTGCGVTPSALPKPSVTSAADGSALAVEPARTNRGCRLARGRHINRAEVLISAQPKYLCKRSTFYLLAYIELGDRRAR